MGPWKAGQGKQKRSPSASGEWVLENPRFGEVVFGDSCLQSPGHAGGSSAAAAVCCSALPVQQLWNSGR